MSPLTFTLGLAMWLTVLWDGFATIVLPRSATPLRRISGFFYHWTWKLWVAISSRIQRPDQRQQFLAVYGPLSVMLLLVLWASLAIFAFALVIHGSGVTIEDSSHRSAHFGAILYMSGSTFLTLGLGDVLSPDPLGRVLVLLDAGTGFIFLGLIITYMPLLDQAYASREVGNMLLATRIGDPPHAMQMLYRYTREGYGEILRTNLREAERWVATVLQSLVSHPVVAFYRAQRSSQSWLISLAVLLDVCAMLTVCGKGLLREQARLTFRLGLRLLEDLTRTLSLPIPARGPARLTAAELPALREFLSEHDMDFHLDEDAQDSLLQLHRLYDPQLRALATWLVIPLPSWLPDKPITLDSIDRILPANDRTPVTRPDRP